MQIYRYRQEHNIYGTFRRDLSIFKFSIECGLRLKVGETNIFGKFLIRKIRDITIGLERRIGLRERNLKCKSRDRW